MTVPSAMEISDWLRRLFVSLVAVTLYQNGGLGVLGGGIASTVSQTNFTADAVCVGPLQCGQQTTSMPSGEATPTSQASSPVYYYDEARRSCQPIPEGCSMPPGGSFPDPALCMRVCHIVGGCASTKHGCCPDMQTPRSDELACPEEEEKSAGGGGGSTSSSVRWDFVASGLLGAVLLLSVIAVAGIASYSYRRKQRQRQRSRYIQEVLQMFHDSSSGDEEDSDSSFMEDNPESNNLFDQL